MKTKQSLIYIATFLLFSLVLMETSYGNKQGDTSTLKLRNMGATGTSGYTGLRAPTGTTGYPIPNPPTGPTGLPSNPGMPGGPTGVPISPPTGMTGPTGK